MTDDMIRYDLLAQDALRGVVRKVLTDVVRHGLPGEHHFYIAFDTTYPGVSLSARMREQYPNEMTIVLQHQFWDLAVGDHAFEVGLSFGNVPERLVIPFDAVKGFFDPSVQFGLQFEIIDLDEDESEDEFEVELEEDEDGEEAHADNEDGEKPQKGRAVMKKGKGQKSLPKGAGSEPQALPAPSELSQIKPKSKKGGPKKAPPQGPGADIVSLDKFRKPKT
ncbi:MAG: ClpXP protease specificity-enhancing factor SspB [Pseudomonadota bacterium]